MTVKHIDACILAVKTIGLWALIALDSALGLVLLVSLTGK